MAISSTQVEQISSGLVYLARQINALVKADKDNVVEFGKGLTGLQDAIDALDFSQVISDTTNSAGDLTYSIDKIRQLLQQQKDDLIAGAPGVLDTFNEVAQKLAAGDDAVSAILSGQAMRVAVDHEQTFNDAQRAQARTNISAVSKAEHANLRAALGDLSYDFEAAIKAEITAGTLPV